MTGRHLAPGLIVGALVLAPLPVPAQVSDCPDWVARTVSVQGRVETRRAGQVQWLPVKLEATHCPGDAVRLGPLSRAALALRDGAILRLDQNTTITFTPTPERAATWIELLTGAVHFWSRMPRGLRITTPFVNGSVEGTEFLIEVDAVEARLSVWEGRILAENAQGSLTLTAGQSAVARAGQPPMLRPIVVKPTDAVEWALYYPPVLDLRPDDFPDRPGETWPAELRRSLAAAQAGDLEAAFASLASVPDTVTDPRVFTYRASLLLAVGRPDEARPAIERALELDPGYAPALALQSVVAVAQNARAEAVRLANEAVARDPSSVAARVAQSYARQAAFDLSGAKESLEAGARLDPSSALVRARLAELWLAEGHVDRALHEAEEAVRLGPTLGRTHTVLGFVRLAQFEIGLARESFERSITLDPAAPLSRLGLGLARIRRGDLERGRQDLEVAVSLDPADSLLRSYLGKAYYEERRPTPAASQLERAEALDPADPTPWFYQAILQQSVNRPAEALQSLQRSIELNDNRAVYRSRLLLDEDLAARSASLARIYDDLGFSQLALVEGFKSLSNDPTNYSAHRFLADAYATLPRHQIAQISEILQSQLLQPINITPVPPRLAAGNLFILSGAGPADPSFNEFNPLFNRDRLTAQLSGVVGGNETYGDELVLGGVWDRFSFSLGQFHFQTDGFRPNNDQREDIYNLFAQYSLSSKTTIQAEFRSTKSDRGDLPLRFDPENFSPTLRQEIDIKSIRLGVRHSFAPHSDVIASLSYQDADFSTNIAPDLILVTDEDRYVGELQYLLRRRPLKLIIGAGHSSADRRDVETLFAPPVTTSITVRHTNVYLYSYLDLIAGLTLTAGVSADFLRGAVVDRDQVNPKGGLIWNPWPSTTLRAAAFRTLRRTLIANQTIEPTNVAGFNQFFDDLEAADAWRYGIGLDQVLHRRLYAGAELSKRDLEVPIGLRGRAQRVDWSEDAARAYLYWTPLDWLALSAEYEYERFQRDAEANNPGDLAKLDTHRVPLTMTLYHPSGLSFRLRGTYVDQEGRIRNAAGDVVSGSDRFLVLDASIAYRLPRRWGLVTIEAKNLLDERFRFQDTDPASPRIAPERLVLVRFTLAY